MKKIFFTLIVLLLIISSCKDEKPFKLTDLHIHIKGDLTLEEAILKSQREGIQYGIAANCGLGFPIENDHQIDSFLMVMKDYPMFYIGMQAEGREWMVLFSEESRNKFDYVFTDAMTFTDEKGRRNRIWINEETWIDNEDTYMEYLVKTTVDILTNEPINIFVNPTYLPEQLANRYDYFWTHERMDRVIDAAKNKNIAIEINNRFLLPSETFIAKAHKAGLKFTIGTNNVDKSFSGAGYAQKMIAKFDLKESDFYIPQKRYNNHP